MLTLREFMQGVDPWVSFASSSLLLQKYQGLLRRLAYIALLFYYTGYVKPDSLLYTQIFAELLRSKRASGGEADYYGKHWTLNIVEIVLTTLYGEFAAYFFPGHRWKSVAFVVVFNLFVFPSHIVQLWAQTWLATVVRVNGNTWKWRDWIIDTTLLSLTRKMDYRMTRSITWTFWWILYKLLILLQKEAICDQLAACIVIRLLVKDTTSTRFYAKWAQRALLCRFILQNLGQFANPDPQEYKYPPLEHSEDIRVILLYPRCGLGKICCTLQQGPIMSTLFYEAISYNWGTMDASEDILVDGCTMKVTKSVYEILNTYSSLFLPKLLWIDAICIDQNNDAEKSQQVPLMERIYSNAVFTTVFLGRAPLEKNQNHRAPSTHTIPYRYDSLRPPDDKTKRYFENTELAFDLLKEFHVLKGNVLPGSGFQIYQVFETLKLSRKKRRQWSALLKMIQHPWFLRVWVIQEVALSSSVRLRYGDEIIDWETLSMGIDKLARARAFQIWLEVEHGVHLSNIQNSSLYNIVRINEFREKYRPRAWDFWDDHNDSYWDSFGLERVLAHSSYFQATNPRDLIFGLMSLCDKPLKVDYMLSVEEVYLNAAKRLIEDEAFELLFHASGIGNRNITDHMSPKLPSWVPDWRETPSYRRLENQVDWKRSNFGAGGESKPSIKLRSGKVLGLSVYFIDTITQLGPAFFNSRLQSSTGIIDEMRHLAASYETCVKLVDESSSVPNPYTYGVPTTSLLETTGIQPRLEAFHRTLFLDRKWISWRARSSLEFYKLFAKWEEDLRFFCDHDNMQIVLASEKDILQERLRSMDKITNKIRSCCGGRRFFITSNGYMGLCPPYAMKGDHIGVVPGLHVPVILRSGGVGEAHVQIRDTRKRSHLVGECYVNGLMDGEGLSTPALLEDLDII